MSNETTDILTALYHTMPHALGYHEDALMTPEQADELGPDDGIEMRKALAAMWTSNASDLHPDVEQVVEDVARGSKDPEVRLWDAYAQINTLYDIWCWCLNVRLLAHMTPSRAFELCVRVAQAKKGMPETPAPQPNPNLN